jgi:carboxyl-terminal processing protease
MRLTQHQNHWHVGLAVVALLTWSVSVANSGEKADTAKPAPLKAATTGFDRKHVDEMARRIFTITDVVLAHHIAPPTRQEMILSGLRSAIATKNLPAPELSRRVSDLRTVEELTELLNEQWPKFTQKGEASGEGAETALIQGLLQPVPGSPSIMPAKEARVQAQIQANRYIGIGIALSMDDNSKLPQIKHAMAGGPAALGGVKDGELIEQINHKAVPRKAKLADVVDELRGPEGSELTLRVRQPHAKQSRTLALVRLPVMFKSVKSSRENDQDDRLVLLSKKPKIAYLKIDSIMASTARELASWEPKIREAKAEGVILDLRGADGHESFDGYHSALLLADSLLDSKPIGELTTRDGSRKFAADRECLFRDLPLAVLIDESTNGPAAWVAAALQDADPPDRERRRAILVGRPSGADIFARSAFPLPGGDELVLPMGTWQRPLAGKQLRQVRSYSQFVGGNTATSTVTQLSAKSESTVVVPDALVLVIDPMAGVQWVEIVTAPKEKAGQAYPAATTGKWSKPGEAKPDPYHEAAIAELQKQIGLAAAKK